MVFMTAACCLGGVFLYSNYANCDPLLAGYIEFTDEVSRIILRGTASPTPKSACFVLYLKIVKKYMAIYCNYSKDLKISIKI